MRPFGRILLTNDDGIDAPGLKVAEDIAAQLAEEVWVVAPEHDQSGVGQGISLHTPLRVYHHGERRFAVSGTPADCVMFAMAEWFEEEAPDLVLSGVNCGANLSDSVMYSGTVGAVLAAAHLGLPGIALSQAFVDRANRAILDGSDTPFEPAGVACDKCALSRLQPAITWSIIIQDFAYE